MEQEWISTEKEHPLPRRSFRFSGWLVIVFFVVLFSMAMGYQPLQSLLWQGMGNLYWRFGDTERASGALHRSVELDSENVDKWLSLVSFHEAQGQKDQALQALVKAKKSLNIPAQQWRHIADGYGRLGHGACCRISTIFGSGVLSAPGSGENWV